MNEDFDIRREMSSAEKDFENALRPLRFHDFSGQKKVVENLEVFVEAAKYRGEPLDHTLLHGPPGLGKTTLSNIIANELGVGFKITSGPVLDKPGDLAGILTSLEPNDVLFIDEIHRLSPVVEEYLYSAMEDYRIDIMIDKGRSGLLTAPLRARFGINMHLEYYEPETLQKIVKRSAYILKVPITDEASMEIARRSRGTPRIANALLRRVRDFAQVKGNGNIDTNITKMSLTALNIDQYGLDEIDNKILLTIIDKFKGGPVGVGTIATAIGEDAGTVEEVYEPIDVEGKLAELKKSGIRVPKALEQQIRSLGKRVDSILEQRAKDLGRKVSFVSLLDRMSDIQIQQNTLLSLRLTPPDVHAVMRQYAYNTFDFDKAEQIIADGKRIMNEALDKYENQ